MHYLTQEFATIRCSTGYLVVRTNCTKWASGPMQQYAAYVLMFLTEGGRESDAVYSDAVIDLSLQSLNFYIFTGN